ncbi:MAG: patatin-like phospholipase family protein [Bacteroidales bacterium]|nr:patatin-like phospholipase family protein [Bacteroidales bacterium]
MKKLFFSLAFLFLLSGFPFTGLFGQKVAVVLSGGGAKGVCHIGVLKALEEAGIPIDYIAGTSMGAIVGGLYAAGYSPGEMEQLVTSPEFTEWVSGRIDPQYIYYFRKPYADASWMTFKFKYDSVLQTQLPTNIVSPVRMDFAFMELFANASAAANYNFDSLMVPFRCVASDVDANKPVVLKSGDLGSSIRASMTFPFYFKPIRINGKLLFDGGMYNNFPSDVAYEDFFPDIIIGSKAAQNAQPPSDDNVVSQLTNMLMEKSNYNVICESGVMIEPQLKVVNG